MQTALKLEHPKRRLMRKEKEGSRISSNVGELDDISRLKEKEGYPEPEVKTGIFCC